MTDNNKKTILIVEDEADVMSYLETLFEVNGYNVESAANGRAGYEIAKSGNIDLISLDITMPEESGVKMYRNLFDDPETRDIPVIIVTGVSGEFKRFLESRKQVEPPAGYFEKPINRDAVLAKIKELIG